eukprot:gnl/TRDRNA2_/TRDRNA2_74886_c0_seq1.p1 gnl/TRDRNA2_/TRDRNA2_74886_c0~~gnl/TRDRNA2_/TRDRNA2_74886_c0_seq1.p1  ORF type:complete len:404 (-),score=99.77 gnl/TRDRNA2_/TRDRNA2_74886_c0_seq1:95-1159(-)
MFTNVSLLNVVTAVVVEKVFSIAQNEASSEAKQGEAFRQKALRNLTELFSSIDVDHNDTLDPDEFREALKDPNVIQYLLELGIARYEADELFECLDMDGNKELSVAEFADGCLRATGPAKSKHMLQVQYDVLRSFKSLARDVAELHVSVRHAVKHMSRLEREKTGAGKARKVADQRASDSSVAPGAAPAAGANSDSAPPAEASSPGTGSSQKAGGGSAETGAAAREMPSAGAAAVPSAKDVVSASSGAGAGPAPATGEVAPPSPRRRRGNVGICDDPASAGGPSISATATSTKEKDGKKSDGKAQKPISSLLNSAKLEQREISRVIEGLLEELNELHGHVSEVVAFNWNDEVPS